LRLFDGRHSGEFHLGTSDTLSLTLEFYERHSFPVLLSGVRLVGLAAIDFGFADCTAKSRYPISLLHYVHNAVQEHWTHSVRVQQICAYV
jgi:hypothetical protein